MSSRGFARLILGTLIAVAIISCTGYSKAKSMDNKQGNAAAKDATGKPGDDTSTSPNAMGRAAKRTRRNWSTATTNSRGIYIRMSPPETTMFFIPRIRFPRR